MSSSTSGNPWHEPNESDEDANRTFYAPTGSGSTPVAKRTRAQSITRGIQPQEVTDQGRNRKGKKPEPRQGHRGFGRGRGIPATHQGVSSFLDPNASFYSSAPTSPAGPLATPPIFGFAGAQFAPDPFGPTARNIHSDVEYDAGANQDENGDEERFSDREGGEGDGVDADDEEDEGRANPRPNPPSNPLSGEQRFATAFGDIAKALTLLTKGSETKKGIKIEKPTKFDGRRPEVSNWLFSMEQYLKLADIRRDEVATAATFLEGSAATWWRLLVEANAAPRRWTDFYNAVFHQFKAPNAIYSARNRLDALKQTTSVTAYNEAFNRTIMEIPDIAAAEMLDRYVRGLKTEIRKEVTLRAPRTFFEAMNVAARVDAILFESRRSERGQDRRPEQFRRQQTARPQGSYNQGQDSKPKYSTWRPRNDSKTVNKVDTPKSSKERLSEKDAKNRQVTGKCYNCGIPGHRAKDCRRSKSTVNQIEELSDSDDNGDTIHAVWAHEPVEWDTPSDQGWTNHDQERAHFAQQFWSYEWETAQEAWYRWAQEEAKLRHKEPRSLEEWWPACLTTTATREEESMPSWGTEESDAWTSTSAGASWDEISPSTHIPLQSRETLSSKAFRNGRCIHGIRFYSPEDECWQCRVADMKAEQQEELIFQIDDQHTLQVVPLSKDTKLPARATPGSVGYDLYAHESCIIPADQTGLVPLNFKIAFPDGYYGQIFERSSLALKNVTVRGGVIDQDYRGEVKVILHNGTNKPFFVNKNDKIAQLVLLKCAIPEVEVVLTLDDTARGNQGFGSTDICSTVSKWDTLILTADIEGQKVKCLVDSGAGDCYLSENLVKKIGLRTTPLKTAKRVKVADGFTHIVQDACPALPISFKDFQDEIDAKVIPLRGTDVILGMTWLQKNNPQIDWRDHVLTWRTSKGEEVTLRAEYPKA
jgi:dUTP pyrophosphatase